MSRNWTKEELDIASSFMKSKGFPSYEEFCKLLEEQEKEEKKKKEKEEHND